MHFCSLVHDFGQKFEILFFLSSSWWATLLMEKNSFSTILDKRPWDSTAIYMFFSHFSVPS